MEYYTVIKRIKILTCARKLSPLETSISGSEDTSQRASLLHNKRRTVSDSVWYALTGWYWMCHLCLDPQCHDTLRWQNFELLTVTKGHFDNMGENGGRENGKGGRLGKNEPLYLKNILWKTIFFLKYVAERVEQQVVPTASISCANLSPSFSASGPASCYCMWELNRWCPSVWASVTSWEIFIEFLAPGFSLD